MLLLNDTVTYLIVILIFVALEFFSQNLVLEGSAVTLDKSLLFWMLSYFLHLASTMHLNADHIR